jgi:protein TonB
MPLSYPPAPLPPSRPWRLGLIAGTVVLHGAVLAWWVPHAPMPPTGPDGVPTLEVRWIEPAPAAARPEPATASRPQPPRAAIEPSSGPQAPRPSPTPAVVTASAPADAAVPAAATAVATAPGDLPATRSLAVAAEPPAVSASAPPAGPVTPAPSPARTPEPRTLSIGVVSYLMPPRLEYPPGARRAQEEGRVQVRVLVDAAGLPQTVELRQGSGHARLDDAALATARATRFRPHTEDGVPKPFWVLMPFVFQLEP